MTVHLLSVPAAAQRLGVSRDSVYRMIHAGQLAAVDVSTTPGIGRTHIRIRSDEVERLIETRTTRATALRRPA